MKTLAFDIPTFSHWLIRMLLAPLAVMAPCFAQGRANEFLQIPVWSGTMSITGSGSGTTTVNGIPYQWQYSVNANITVKQMTDTPQALSFWSGAIAGSDTWTYKESTPVGNCTQSRTTSGSGLFTPQQMTLSMLGTLGPNQYRFGVVPNVATGTDSLTLTCPTGTPITIDTPIQRTPLGPDMTSQTQTLPATGFSLKGSQTVKMGLSLPP